MGTLPQRFSHVFLSCLLLITLFHFASAFKSSLNAHFFRSYLYCILSCVYVIVLYTRGLRFFFFFKFRSICSFSGGAPALCVFEAVLI